MLLFTTIAKHLIPIAVRRKTKLRNMMCDLDPLLLTVGLKGNVNARVAGWRYQFFFFAVLQHHIKVGHLFRILTMLIVLGDIQTLHLD